MVDLLQNAQTPEMSVIFSKTATYVDKIYTSYDPGNKIVRITFCESWSGSNNMNFVSAVVVTEAGLDSLVKLLQDVQQKFKDGALKQTLQ